MTFDLFPDPGLSGAACTGRAPLFDLDATSAEDTDTAAARFALAARICRTCPAATGCRALADRHCPRTSGVWAGRLYGAPRALSNFFIKDDL